MEELQIQCPSCRVLLNVRNSKNEAVKEIVCPNCKKRLAVTFRGNQIIKKLPIEALYEGTTRFQLDEGVNVISGFPSEDLKIEIVRLDSGESKCLLKVLSDKISVYVNQQLLQTGDVVTLLRGDEMQIEGRVFTFGVMRGQHAIPLKKHHSLAGGAVAAMIVTLLIVAFWRGNSDSDIVGAFVSNSDEKKVIKPKDIGQNNTKMVDGGDAKIDNNKVSKQVSPLPKSAIVSSKPSYSIYELEIKASKGDVNAQYQIGERWIQSTSCADVKKGEQYLRLAANQGSADAMYVLGRFYLNGSSKCGIMCDLNLSHSYMEKAASRGHKKAIKYLKYLNGNL